LRIQADHVHQTRKCTAAVKVTVLNKGGAFIGS